MNKVENCYIALNPVRIKGIIRQTDKWAWSGYRTLAVEVPTEVHTVDG